MPQVPIELSPPHARMGGEIAQLIPNVISFIIVFIQKRIQFMLIQIYELLIITSDASKNKGAQAISQCTFKSFI